MVTFGGRNFRSIRGSDIQRDGMFIELYEEPGDTAAEVFFSDVSREMVFTAFAPNIPVDAVEWLIGEARKLLPPAADISASGTEAP